MQPYRAVASGESLPQTKRRMPELWLLAPFSGASVFSAYVADTWTMRAIIIVATLAVAYGFVRMYHPYYVAKRRLRDEREVEEQFRSW